LRYRTDKKRGIADVTHRRSKAWGQSSATGTGGSKESSEERLGLQESKEDSGP